MASLALSISLSLSLVLSSGASSGVVASTLLVANRSSADSDGKDDKLTEILEEGLHSRVARHTSAAEEALLTSFFNGRRPCASVDPHIPKKKNRKKEVKYLLVVFQVFEKKT